MRQVLVAFVCSIIPTVSIAAPIGLRTTAHVEYATDECTRISTSAADCGFTVTWTDPENPELGWATFQSAEATAAFGALSASAFHVITDYTGGVIPFVFGIGTAEFTDELTFAGGSGSGFVRYHFSGGINNVTDDPDAMSGFLFSHAGSPTQGILTSMAGEVFTPEPFTYISPLMPFAWDSPFELYVYAQARIGSFGLTIGSATVTLDGIDVFNANGQLVNAALVSASNTDYNVTAIPEPTTFLLVGAGLVAATRRRLLSGERSGEIARL